MTMPPHEDDLHQAISPPAEFFELCQSVGLELEPAEVAGLHKFVGLLLDANTRMNLTGIHNPAELWTRHVFDALTLMAVLEELEGPLDILDIGSGGGLPALPLAVVRPQDRFTLLEATAKKCDFLREAAESLGLHRVEVICGRAEKYGHDRGTPVDRGGERVREGGMRDRFDVVTCRAVGRVAVAAELCVPFAKEGGLVVLVKGARAQEEMVEAKAALHMLHAAESAIVPTPTGQLVVLEKLRATPKVYPRPDGEPKRSPLGVSGKVAGREGGNEGSGKASGSGSGADGPPGTRG